MIITAKNHIPRLWIFIAAMPWAAALLKFLAMGGAFQFSLLKFIENPAGLTFIMSLPALISLVLNPVVNFMSDRVWTRFGRRKPFVIASWVGTIASISVMPLMPNIWALIACYMVYSLFNDIGQPIETLKQEIVPPRQRGLSTAIGTWIFNFSILTFNFVALGRFDDYKFMAGFPVSGEQSIYWTVSAAMVVMLLLIMLGIKETDPKSSLRGERFSIRRFFTAILSKYLWPVYLLIFGYAMMNAGLGVMGTLLYIEQWGFTKQEMGFNFAVGGVLNCFFIIIIGCFADKLPRMKTYQILMAATLVVNFCFYIYVHHFIYDQRPSLVELIVFGETLSVMGILLGLIYTPMVYDYIRRNEMGTFAAGQNLLGKITGFITLNGVGLFVWGYATLFMPPGGDTTRIALNDPVTEGEVRNILESAGLKDPETGTPAKLSVETWYATGAAVAEGRAFEIRRANPDSVKLNERRGQLAEEEGAMLAREKNETLWAESAKARGRDDLHARHAAEALRLNAARAPLAAEIAQIDATLQSRADAFHQQVAAVLGGRLASDTEAIGGAFTGPAVFIEFPTGERPFVKDVERVLDRMRLADPRVIDLRVVRRDRDYVLVLSAALPDGTTPEQVGRDLGALLGDSAKGRMAGVLVEPVTPTAIIPATLTGFTTAIVEDPLDRFPSPITRVMNRIIDWFADPPVPERRVFGLARGMRMPGSAEHVDVRAAPDGTHAIQVRAIFIADPAGPPTAQAGRFAELLGTDRAAEAARAAALHARLVEISPQQRITPIRSHVSSSFTKMKYDYMSGYIWMFLLGAVGLVITFAFVAREKKGLIQKRGREEADAEIDAPVGTPEAIAERVTGETYTPGYFWPKIGMAAVGLAIFGFACVNLVPALATMATGERAYAEATRVIKEKLGGESITLTTDAEVLAACEKRDRTFVFWNEYHFRDTSGRDIDFRAPAGGQLRPVQNLFDDNGMPSVVTVYYDPADPQKLVLPGMFSTWFMPGTLALFGLAGFIIGLILATYANRPIPVPHIEPT